MGKKGSSKAAVKTKAAKNTFKLVIEATPDIKDGYHPGLQALKNEHRKMIEMKDLSACQGSVDIDACCARQYPQANRWDYAIGYAGEVYFAEPHTAGDSEVKVVLRKLQWLKDWLQTQAPELNKLKAKKQPYTWLQSNRYALTPNSPWYRLAAQAGILPKKKLVLPP